MDFSKLKNKLLIVLCLFVLILPFYLITFCYADDTIPGTVLNGVGSSGYAGDTVTLESINNAKGIYFPVRAGFTYSLDFDLSTSQVYRLFISGDTPAVDVEGLVLYREYIPSKNYIFTATQDGYLFFWNYDQDITNSNTIFQVVGDVMSSSVSSLVDNVGIGQFWEVFSDAIPMISVMAFFVFGFVIITYLYLKLSKGKEGL